jgi:xanthine dehydrogenase accessory factor
MAGSVSGGCVENAVAIEALDVIATGEPIMLTYGFTVDQAFEVGLPCGDVIDVFVERAPQDGSRLEVLHRRRQVAQPVGAALSRVGSSGPRPSAAAPALALDRLVRSR